jgi:hypothetical protein
MDFQGKIENASTPFNGNPVENAILDGLVKTL